jgi:ABC-2 type transport system permease protein
MLYRDRQALLVAFVLPLIFVFAFRLFDLQIVLAGAPAVRDTAAPSATGYFEFVLPGLLAMGIMNFAVFSVAVALSTFRDQQVLARISVTPVSPAVFLAGQLGSRAVLALAQVAVVLAAGYLLGLRYGVGALWLFALAVPGSLIFLNLGFVLAGWSRSVTAATGMANLIVLPLTFLSGVFLPVDALPGGLPGAVAFLPLAPLTDLMRAALLDLPQPGGPAAAALVLAGWLAATTVLAAASFRRLLRR